MMGRGGVNWDGFLEEVCKRIEREGKEVGCKEVGEM